MNLVNQVLQGIPRRPLATLLTTLGAINILAWVGALELSAARPGLLALAGLAWIFGARHAFDVDHIAAIDNVTRKFRQEGRTSVAVGFFFALGHSSVVIALSALIALGTLGTKGYFSVLSHLGHLLGTGISAAFLTLIGLINLAVLKPLFQRCRAYHNDQDSSLREDEIDDLLNRRGLFARSFHFLNRRINRSWKMYPLGFLFGLGFDTATEVAILGLSATLATHAGLPVRDIMLFPLLFTAGMTLMDTLDGIIMLRAYHWALSDSVRRLYFNTLITTLAVGTALVIGAFEWLQLLTPHLLGHRFTPQWLLKLNFGTIGLVLVAMMLTVWAFALLHARFRGTPRTALASDSD